MIVRIKNAKVYDPTNKVDGRIKDIFIKDGKIIKRPNPKEKISQVINLKNKIVMPGGIDIHSHIAGGKVNLARLLLPEEHPASQELPENALQRRAHS